MNAPDGVSTAVYTGSQIIWGRLKFEDVRLVVDMLHAARLVTTGDDAAWMEYLYDSACALRDGGKMEVEA